MGGTKTATGGRPRTYEPGTLRMSEKERKLAERVMNYAREFNTSFEKAFAQVALGRPELSEVTQEMSADRKNPADAVSTKPDKTPQAMLSLGAAAREAHVAKATLGRWLESGEIEGTKVQGVWQIHPDQLERMAEIKTRAKRGGHRQKTESDRDSTAALISALERLIESEQLRADAAEYRYDQLVGMLRGKLDVP